VGEVQPGMGGMTGVVGAGQPQTLLVNVMNARGLYNADGFLAGKSDPYCICLIPGKKKSQFTTPTVNNCLDPDWNFTGKIPEFEAGDSLEFQVWDADTFPKPDQLLGKVTLSPQDFDAHPDGLTGVLQLTGGKSQELGTLEVCIQVDLHGEVATGAETELTAQQGAEAQYTAGSVQAEQVAQQATGEAGRPLGHVNPHLAGAKMAKLKVTVYRAHNLYNADGFMAGKSDPYVICMVQDSGHQHGQQHGKKDRKFQTKVINNNLEPQWNHLGIINGYMEGEVLEFQVWDKDTFPKPDDLLGKVTLSSADFFPQGLEGELPLYDSKGQGSTLTIRIECVPDTEATGLSAPRTSIATPVKRISAGGVTYVTGGQGYYPGGQVTYSAGGYPGAQYSTTGATYAMPGQAFSSGQPVTYTAGQPAAYSVSQPSTYSVGQPTVIPSSPVNYSSGAPTTYASPTTTFTAGAPTYTSTPGATYTMGAPGSTYAVGPSGPVTTFSASPVPAPSPIYTSTMPMQAAPAPAPMTLEAEPQVQAFTMPATTSPAMPTVTYAQPGMPPQAMPQPTQTTFSTAAPAQPSYQVMPSTFTASPPSIMAASSPAPVTTYSAPATTYAAPPATTYAAASVVPAPYTAEPATTFATPATTFATETPSVTMQPTPVTYTAGAPATTYGVPATSYKMPAPCPVACGAPQVQMMAPQPMQMAPQPMVQMQPMQMQPQPMPTQQVQMGLPQYGAPAAPMIQGGQVMYQGGVQPQQAQQQGLFEMLDQNHDGVITRSEFAAAAQRIH